MNKPAVFNPDIVLLEAQAVELLHRNKMHPSYMYRQVMHSADAMEPLDNNELPLPTEESGWERNLVGDGRGDPDYYVISWRKLHPHDEADAMAGLRSGNGMHRDTALSLLNRLGGLHQQECEFPMRMGQLLLSYHPDNTRGPTLSYKVRLKNGKFSNRREWMPFAELPLSVEDFHFQFKTPVKDYVEVQLAAMLGAYFPELDVSIVLDVASSTTAAHTNRGGPPNRLPKTEPRSRTEPGNLTAWIKVDDRTISVITLCSDSETYGFNNHVGAMAALWKWLGENKVRMYEEYDNFKEKYPK